MLANVAKVGRELMQCHQSARHVSTLHLVALCLASLLFAKCSNRIGTV